MKIAIRIATWALALVVVAFALLKSGRYSITSDLSLQSYAPSGTAAFLELAKKLGYAVKFDDTIAPNVQTVNVIPFDVKDTEAVLDYLKRHADKNTRTLLLKVDTSNVLHTPTNQQLRVMEPGSNKVLTVSAPYLYDRNFDEGYNGEFGSNPFTLMQSDYSNAIKIRDLNGGKVITVDNGSFIQNHLIDKEQNAELTSSLLSYVADGSKNINFVNFFAGGGANSSIIERMGAPVESAWSQIWLAAILIFAANCVRFGKAPFSRAKQGSQHELALAIAQTLRASKNPAWALREIFDRTMLSLERRHRVSRTVLLDDASSPLPPEHVEVLNLTLDQLRSSTSERDLLVHAKNLQRLV